MKKESDFCEIDKKAIRTEKDKIIKESMWKILEKQKVNKDIDKYDFPTGLGVFKGL